MWRIQSGANRLSKHDVHTKQREFGVGATVLAKNFTSKPQWLPGVIVDCVAPLSYSIQLHDGRIWIRHADHIVATQEVVQESPEKVIQDNHAESSEEWSYGTDIEINPSTSSGDPVTAQQQSSDQPRYPVRDRRPPKRLIEQTDL